MSGEKTEQPTPKRLREARERGEVCKSRDVASALTVLALAGYIIFGAERIFNLLREMIVLPMQLMHLPFAEAVSIAAGVVLRSFLLIVLPAVALVVSVGLFANLAQVGVLFAFKGAVPKLENMNPGKWFKQVFSLKNFIELVKNLLKLAVLSWAVYYVMTRHLPDLFSIRHDAIGTLWQAVCAAVKDLFFVSAGAFCFIAGLDYLFQRRQFNKEHMMSKEEVKREYKEMEGDPYIKGRRKQIHQELAAQGTMTAMRKAKVLVTNPTHLAVAIDYEKGETPLPVIVAKGEGLLAERMIAAAREQGIPIMRNVPLAHDLFTQGTENAYIPKDLIGPVAEVLRWVQSLRDEA